MEVTPTAGHDPDRRRREASGGATAIAAAGAAALDLMPDAVVVVAADGTVATVNDMAARLLGVAAGELAGRRAADVLTLTDETGADWWSCVRPLVGDPHVGHRLVERDLMLRTADGRQRPVTVTARRIAGHVGDESPGHDVAAAVVSLRTAEQRRRVDAARSDLVSTVSHELRSPLTSVKGFTKTLLAKWDRFSDEQKRHMLAVIDEDADRVTRLLGELLDVSRIDAGRLPLARQMIDLAAVADKVLDGFRMGHSDREYVNAITADTPRIFADRDKMAQVLTNLVENATHYGRGRIEVHVDMPAAPHGGYLRCTVSDQGGGIKEANLRHIFTKFHRRQGERHAGTGLGLYITKGIVEAHGGTIWAESDAEVATRLSFTVPLGGLELAGITEETRRLATERR